MAQEYPKISPAPDWRAIFSKHYELSPPGYDETFLHCLQNPYVSPKQREREAAEANKKSRKLGRGQKRA